MMVLLVERRVWFVDVLLWLQSTNLILEREDRGSGSKQNSQVDSRDFDRFVDVFLSLGKEICC